MVESDAPGGVATGGGAGTYGGGEVGSDTEGAEEGLGGKLGVTIGVDVVVGDSRTPKKSKVDPNLTQS